MKRLRRAHELYYALRSKGTPRDEILFVSTVKDRGPDGMTKSEAIKDELIRREIPEGQIVISQKSHDTWTDVINSLRLVLRRKLPQPVIIVSNCDHIWPRTQMIARFWGWRMKIRVRSVSIGPMKASDSLKEFPKTIKAMGMILNNLFGKTIREWNKMQRTAVPLYFAKENVIPFFRGWPPRPYFRP